MYYCCGGKPVKLAKISSVEGRYYCVCVCVSVTNVTEKPKYYTANSVVLEQYIRTPPPPNRSTSLMIIIIIIGLDTESYSIIIYLYRLIFLSISKPVIRDMYNTGTDVLS